MTVTKTLSVGFYNDLFEITRKTDSSMIDATFELVSCDSGKKYELNSDEFLDLYEVLSKMYEEVGRVETRMRKRSGSIPVPKKEE